MAAKTTAMEKAAAVIISLGADNASEVYKHLKEEEVEMLSLEISKLKRMQPEEMKDIMDDFYGLCVTQKVINEGGVDYARDILEKAFGQQQASTYMDRLSKSLKTKAFDFLRRADYKNLMSIIQNEHPQTVALILSYASSDQASKIISEFSPEKKVDVVERIAKLDGASPEAIEIIERVLESKFAAVVSVDLMEVGGVSYIADIMNNVDRSTEKQIFDQLEAKSPELAEEIKKLMFVFEDILFLDDISIQRFIRDVDTKDLSVALKVANEEVSDCFFRNMSQRMKEQVKTDIDFLQNVRMRDVEEAQQKIVTIIRKLETEGELIISKGGKDDIVV